MTVAQGDAGQVGQALADRAMAPPGIGKTIQQEIRELGPEFKRGLAGMIDEQRFMRIVFTELRNKPDLLDCTRESVLGAVMQSAQLGLEFGPLQHAYLVPFRNHGTLECQFMIGYRGYIDLARRSGSVKDIVAVEVYDNDEFDFYRDENGDHLMHRPFLKGDRGPITHYYGRVVFTNGGNHVQVMTLDDIEERRKRSATSGSNRSPWKSDPVPMSRKTVIRALVPWLPLTTEVAEKLRSDEAVVRYRGEEEMTTEYPDSPVVGGGGPALQSAVPPERQAAESELEDLIQGYWDTAASQAWLMTNYGPIPTLTDDQLEEAAMRFEEWAHDQPQAPQGPPPADGATQGATEAPIEAQAESRPSEDIDPALLESTTRTVTAMSPAKVRETIGLFRDEGETGVPTIIGGQRVWLIQRLVRERLAGNQAAQDLF